MKTKYNTEYNTEKTEFTVKADGFHGKLFLPEEDRFPDKALIVWGGSEGMFKLSCMGAERFAAEGITVLALAFFKAPGLPDKLLNVPIESVENAARYLKAHGYGKIAVWGISMGSQLALLSGIYMPELITCVIAASPICFATQGLNAMTLKTYPGSIFSWRGKQIPCACYDPKITKHGKRLILQYLIKHHEFSVMFYYDGIIKNLREEQVLPVEKINGPVLLISGGMDSMWPSEQSARILMRRMDEGGHSFEHKHLHYIHGSHYMMPMHLKSEKLFVAERKYPQDSEIYKRDMMREMMEFLDRW